jgi:2-keto-4-pentenoate hydratase/2-oxohepta-3-ene-1,7-dioic acid hydratase in catechol pathway
MRWVTYRHSGQALERVGRLVDDQIYGIARGVELLDLLGDDGERLARAGEHALTYPTEVVARNSVVLCAPIPRAPAVRDFYAFEEHVRNACQRRDRVVPAEWYEAPVFYFTNPYAIVGPDAAVPVPPGCQEFDFELEVAAVVGRRGENLRPAEAGRCIVGYTIMNDWSARDLQRRELAIGLGPVKAKDFATSLGPMLVTVDELLPVQQHHAFDLTMVARVNGREYTRANLADIYWSFAEMLAYASRGTAVGPGDLIGSGTCGRGCILELSFLYGEAAYPWLQPGDVVELTVDQLGTLSNRVVEGRSFGPLDPRPTS